MEIDRTLFMMASGRDVDNQERHRKVCTEVLHFALSAIRSRLSQDSLNL